MIDDEIRILERACAERPGDEEARLLWRRAMDRAGRYTEGRMPCYECPKAPPEMTRFVRPPFTIHYVYVEPVEQSLGKIGLPGAPTLVRHLCPFCRVDLSDNGNYATGPKRRLATIRMQGGVRGMISPRLRLMETSEETIESGVFIGYDERGRAMGVDPEGRAAPFSPEPHPVERQRFINQTLGEVFEPSRGMARIEFRSSSQGVGDDAPAAHFEFMDEAEDDGR